MTHILAANIGGFPRIGESKNNTRYKKKHDQTPVQ
jgi:hypothetical protein